MEKIDFFKVGGVTNESPIVASYAGRVEATGWGAGPGYYVSIDHGGGWTTHYLHMIKAPMVAVGTTVTAGQQLGNVGSTGNSSAPHLHYEQRRDDVIVQAYFDGTRTTVAPDDSQQLISKNCGSRTPSGADGPATAGGDPAPSDGPKRSVVGDRDGDGKTDLAIFRPSAGTWHITPSSGGFEQIKPFGLATDKLVPGDYDGDRRMDLAVYRPSEGKWYILPSRGTRQRVVAFGRLTDIPVPADYDGDGRTDLALYGPNEGTWYIALSSAAGAFQAQTHGYKTDKLVPGDYDGDGKTDLAVFRPSEANWFIAPSSGAPAQVHAYGYPDDDLVPGDYDGDGKTDLAVFRPREAKWYIRPSGGGQERAQAYGGHSDIPVPGDYDGDGKTDLAFFRPSEGKLYVLPSDGSPEQIRAYAYPAGSIATPQPQSQMP